MDRLICTISKPKANNKPTPGTAASLSVQNRQRGLSANFTGLRGTKSKQVNLQFLGVNSFVPGKRLNFDYDNILTTNTLKGIEILGTAQLAKPLLRPAADIPLSQLVKGLLCLVDHCDNEIIRIPLASLCKELNGNKLTFIDVPNANWAASYVVFPDSTTSISAANALVFNVYYQ